jgi:putative ABC transport system permease protein
MLTAFSMALGVMLLVAILSVHGVIERSFRNNTSLGYNVILGAKGGKLQLTLNTVYYLSEPIENVPYDFYLEFLSADDRAVELQNALRDPGAPRDGEFAPYSAVAIPMCLGDYFGPYRVVGTTPGMFEKLKFGPAGDQTYEFAAGRNFQTWNPEHGFFEAVVGATVARELNVRIGDRISTTHGDPEGKGHGREFTVVGVLAPSGTPQDRATFINMEGFYLMAGHAKPLEENPSADGEASDTAAAKAQARSALRNQKLRDAIETAAAKSDNPQLALLPLPVEQREVTSILLRTSGPLVTPWLENEINEGSVAQAVLPIREIYLLFDMLVKPAQLVLLLMSGLICIVSGVSILVSIYNSMAERRHDIAVMRALGADRQTVMFVILMESVILGVGGGCLGWVLGHGLNASISPLVEQRTGVSIGFFDFAPGIDLARLFNLSSGLQFEVSTELLLIPGLLILAMAVGILPAMTAYRTDVAESLGK